MLLQVKFFSTYPKFLAELLNIWNLYTISRTYEQFVLYFGMFFDFVRLLIDKNK